MIIEQLSSTIIARLVSISATDTIQAAATAFGDRNIGLLVVCDGAGRASGVLSKSDLVRHLAAAAPVETPLASAMTRDIVHCTPQDDLYATWQAMSARRLQNMPVLGAEARPVGVLDIRDALQALLRAEEYQERELVDYISGVGYR